jgi:hypothetical protein
MSEIVAHDKASNVSSYGAPDSDVALKADSIHVERKRLACAHSDDVGAVTKLDLAVVLVPTQSLMNRYRALRQNPRPNRVFPGPAVCERLPGR